MIRPVLFSDAAAICAIYNRYVEETTITFEEMPVTADAMTERIRSVIATYPWLVYEDAGEVVGYTYANRWKERSAYRHSVETGIYLDAHATGKGIGSQLKAAMIEELRTQSIHAIISGVALPNPASIALCEKFGFKKIGVFKEVGFKLGRWVDVGYWELILHRQD